jgi:PPP family 3-phenylpropionic acid transporter
MIIVMSIMALSALAMSILQPMVPLYLTSIGVTPQIIGLMLSLAMVGMVIGESSWGWVADKMGIKFPLIVGTFISGLTVFCFVLTQNMALTFTIFFLWGLVRSALYGPGRGYISTNAPVLRKATFMAIITMIMSASRTIGALPSGFLAENLGFQAVFFVSCGVSLLAGLVVLAGLRQARPSKVQVIGDGVPDPPNLVGRVSYSSFAVLCVVTVLHHWTVGTRISFLPLLATQVVGASTTEVGILFTIYGLTVMLTSVPMGMLADRVGKKKLMIFGCMVSGVAMTGMAFSSSYAGLMFFVITSGLGMATFSPAALGMIAEVVSSRRQGTAMGIYGAFGENIGIIAGSSLGGFMWSAWGPQFTFLTGAIAAALGFAICLSLIKA